MISPFYLALVLLVSCCLYLYTVNSAFRVSSKIPYTRYWLLVPLTGAAIVGVTLILSSPVMFSRDMLAYIATGHAGKSYFVYALYKPPAPFAPILYGPTWLAIASAITGASGQHLSVAIWLFRGLELLAHLVNSLLIWAILGKIAPANRLPGTLLYAWNPLVLIELVINGNAAGVVVCFLLLAVWLYIQRRGRWFDIGALALLGLATSINLLALLLAPLFLCFMVRDARDIRTALAHLTWRALVILAIVVVAYMPVWQGVTTFLAIVDSLNLSNFAYSPLSLVVLPLRALYSQVAQSAQFPSSLMPPSTAADATVLASTFFLFALLYLREMGRVHRPLSLQEESGRPYESLFTSWGIVFLGFVALVSTAFWPWYLVWVVWIVALRRFDTLSVSALLLSCTALLYYPLLQLDLAQAAILTPLCIFGMPLAYVIVQRYLPLSRFERNKVLT
ncbi:MAG: hypothetical protein NVS3B14_09350 [Ktedonobacteraceae bacterium]